MRFRFVNEKKRSFVQHLALDQQREDAEIDDAHGRDRQGETAAVFLEGQIAGFGNCNLSSHDIAAGQPFIHIRERHFSCVFKLQCPGKVIEISWNAG